MTNRRRLALVGVTTLALVAPLRAGASARVARVGDEVPVTAVDERLGLAHNSPVLVADPERDGVVAAASRLDSPDFGCTLHVSGDGGRGWLASNPVPRLPKGADKCYAPEAAFDAGGRLHYLFVGLAGAGNTPMGAFLVSSREGGYTAPRRVLGAERYMIRMVLDPAIGPQGRLHLVWLEARGDSPLGGLPATVNPIMAAYSDDAGRTFSDPVQVSDPERRLVVAPAVAVGADHRVHVAYYDLGEDVRDYQGLEGPPWEGTWSLVVATSGDGGRSFGPGTVVDERLVPPERVMLIYTMPAPSIAADDDANVYVAWHDARNGDWDAFVARSSDAGRSWARPRRLNDDPPGNGSHQYLPRLSVAPGGRLDAVWYDRRDDPENRRNDVRFSSSSDAGESFSPSVKLTGDPSDSQVGPRYPIASATGLVEFGSRIALLSRPSSALAAWTDTRNSDRDSFQQDVFAAEVVLAGAPAGGASAGEGGGAGGLLAMLTGAAAVAGATGVMVLRARRARRPITQEAA